MFCEKCGKELDDDAVFCTRCGNRVKKEEISKEKSKQIDENIEDKKNDKDIIKDNKKNNNLSQKVNRKGSKINIKIVATVTIAVIAIVCVVGLKIYNGQPSVKYKKASKAFENGKYEKAIDIYTELGTYEDSEERLAETIIAKHYADGNKLFSEEDYDGALTEFEQISDYQDAGEMIDKCNYQKACQCKEKGQYVEAASLFKKSNYYEDSSDLIDQMGEELTEQGNYSDAVLVFNNSTTKNNKYAKYSSGMIDLEGKNYSSASTNFYEAGDVFDAKDKYIECVYNDAKDKFNAKDYNAAKSLYSKISDYKDSSNQIEICKLMIAKELYDDGSLNKAKEELEKIKAGTTYNNVSVEGLLESINANSNWLLVCGVWSCTSGQMQTREDASYSYYYWYRDFVEDEYRITVKCKINNDGTVTVKTSGSIPIYTNYSSIGAYLNESTKSVSKEETMSSPGTITIDSDTTVTVSTSSVSVNYKKVDNSHDVYFDYIYSTNITYGKKKQDL